jgi:hypothetical protein
MQQIKSSKAIRVAAKMKEIQDKYKNDWKVAQEQMRILRRLGQPCWDCAIKAQCHWVYYEPDLTDSAKDY